MPGYHRLILPEHYRALISLSARDFAWEWLRRNPAFRAAWAETGLAAQRASARADDAIRRSRRPIVDLPLHPCARRWTHWGIGFRAAA
jgi:hypothetical protein